MRAFLVSVVAISSVVACKKEPSAPRANVPAAPSAPASTADQDALWALAPAGATTGIVVSPRGLAHLEGALHAIRTFTASAPDLAPLHDRLARALEDAFGTREPSLATMGMAANKGFAYFMLSDGGMVVILPVVDRDRFATFATEHMGLPPPMLGELCKEVRGVYACGLGVAPESFGGGTLRANLELVAARGDIEVVHDGPIRGNPVTAAGVLQLDRGAGVVRVAVKGAPSPMFQYLANARPRVHDTTSGFALVNLTGLRDVVPAVPLAADVSLQDLVRSMAGPLTLTVSGGAQPVYEVMLPLSDTTAAQKLVENCAQIEALRDLAASVKDGICHGTMQPGQIAIEGWVEESSLRIGIKGATSGRASSPDVAAYLSPIGRELASRDWFFGFHAQGSLLGSTTGSFASSTMEQLGPQGSLMLRIFALVHEIGLAVGSEGDVLHMIGSLRTVWSNPDDVVAKLLAITSRQLVDGSSARIADEVARSAPSSSFAADHAAGQGGHNMATGMIGVLAAITIPAFMDYTNKSRRIESEVMLNRLAKNLKVYYTVHGSFPQGSVPPSPANSCCEYPRGKCSEPEAWNHPIWKQLDFDLTDEPHLFRYSYNADGTTFTLAAVGDLDCDGIEITYMLTGSVDADGNIVTNLVGPPPNID